MSTAMIWGASGGIGRALLAQLAAEGWTTFAIARHPDGLTSLTQHVIQADVSNSDAVQRAVATAKEQVTGVDLWIYAVGDISATRVADMAPHTWQRVVDANLTGAYLAAHYSLPLLTDDAHLVFLGGVSERLRLPGLAAYAAAKAGLEAFATALAKEERRRRVTVVRPAAVDTTIWQKVPFSKPPNALQPEAVARRILAAHREGHKGTLDL